MQRHFIVSSFQGVDEGTALEGDTTSILANVRVRVHALDRHRQFEFYPVVWLPYAFHSRVALFQVAGHVNHVSVHGETRVLTPAGNAQLQPEPRRLSAVKLDGDRAIPRIDRLLAHSHCTP